MYLVTVVDRFSFLADNSFQLLQICTINVLEVQFYILLALHCIFALSFEFIDSKLCCCSGIEKLCFEQISLTDHGCH